MIKPLLIATLLYILIVSTLTAASPALGFQIATYTALVLSQPILIALKLGLLARGLI